MVWDNLVINDNHNESLRTEWMIRYPRDPTGDKRSMDYSCHPEVVVGEAIGFSVEVYTLNIK